jgi:hypothetical protein
MIEAYAFLGAFALQILLTSVLYPAWFVKYVRMQVTRLPAERLAQMYPGADLAQAQQRFLSRYRALSATIAVVGLLLLGWLFSYLQRPDWDDGPVEVLVTVYFMVAHMVPLGLVIWLGLKFDKEHKHPLPEQTKRKASLQRRGLFDFISPVVVFVAVLLYFLFVAFVLYIRAHPFPGFAGLVNIGGITLVYALNALVVYTMLYGKHRNPLETHAGRRQGIGMAVKSSVYSCIVIVVYLSLNFALGLLDLQRWEPFALSTFFVVCSLLASMGMIARLRRPEADGLGPSPVH